jgi:hypothetical protein
MKNRSLNVNTLDKTHNNIIAVRALYLKRKDVCGDLTVCGVDV